MSAGGSQARAWLVRLLRSQSRAVSLAYANEAADALILHTPLCDALTGWHRCEYELPDRNGVYLVYDERDQMMWTCAFTNGMRRIGIDQEHESVGWAFCLTERHMPTHWRELPDKPIDLRPGGRAV